MTITEFLEARIAEDERRFDCPDFVEDLGSVRSPGWGDRGECPICGAYQFSGTETVTEDGWWDHAEEAHGRRRWLAECAAKRAVMGQHGAVDFSGIGMQSPNACEICGIDAYMGDWEYAKDSFPCATLKALAAVYSDHHGYRQEWAI